MLELRVDDRSFIRLIRKWLNAGVLNPDGTVEHPQYGTPQGSIVSPVLANIYLHYALDKWFKSDVERRSDGNAFLVRYANDFVAAFRYHRDAASFHRRLKTRLAKFSLTLSEEKTR
jgi:RNA-directed DNA polymerase